MTLLRLGAAFLRRDAAVAVSYRLPFLLGIASIVSILALFFYLGRLVDPSVIESRAGFDQGYFAYAALGLALLQIVQVGLVSFALKLRQEQTTGTFEALMSTPAPPYAVVLCSVAWDILRAALSGLFLVAVAVALFGLDLHTDTEALLVAGVALLGCLVLFGAIGIAVAAFAVAFKHVTALLSMVVTGLALLGGVYFPIDLLPDPLQTLGDILPFTWGLDVIRSALLSGDVDGTRLAGLLGSAVVTLPLALAVFKVALRRARREGTLAQY
jgi:ABC-2 type transport system permease protein